jgi:hypothetical protein
VARLTHAHQPIEGRECRATLGNGDDMIHGLGQYSLPTPFAWFAYRLCR